MSKKELPKPNFLVEAKAVTDTLEEAKALVSVVLNAPFKISMRMNLYLGCLSCKYHKLRCKFGLHADLCPICALFNHTEARYRELKKELEERGFNTDWLDQYRQHWVELI